MCTHVNCQGFLFKFIGDNIPPLKTIWVEDYRLTYDVYYNLLASDAATTITTVLL
jgi:hypothetical protein